MKRVFRKYHRAIAPVLVLPLLLTVVSGMGATMIREWGLNLGLTANFLMKIHTGEIFHLEGIYPILNGLGLLALLVTGITMTSMMKKSPAPKAASSK
jgi:hypothetical protein